MHQVIDREILLSFDEMRILLYNMGFKSIRGILMPREEFRREEIIRSMHHMSLHGMICFTEEGFQTDHWKVAYKEWCDDLAEWANKGIEEVDD